MAEPAIPSPEYLRRVIEEELGAQLVQVTLGLEGRCLVGPWEWAGPSDLIGPLATPHLVCLFPA